MHLLSLWIFLLWISHEWNPTTHSFSYLEDVLRFIYAVARIRTSFLPTTQ